MFGITYKIWCDVCDMYFTRNYYTLCAYLQWFPYSLLSGQDKTEIKSEKFYKRYIENGNGLLFPSLMLRTDNYIQKGDGSFRNSTLISPLLYLILQAIGKSISENYQSQRPSDIAVFYAGNYDENKGNYKLSYDNFFKTINTEISSYNYFIKTDIHSFYGNINLNKLLNRIDKIVNAKEQKLTPTYLNFYKEFFMYCGNGKFPLVENSIASSYLSTIIYLDDVDRKLHEYLSSLSSPKITRFKMIRYVDDLYILIQSPLSNTEVKKLSFDIRNKYESILKDNELSLNSSKYCIKESSEISEDLAKSLYDEYTTQQKFRIPELSPNGIVEFLKAIDEKSQVSGCVTGEEYNAIIEKIFSIDDVEFKPTEVLNYFVYDNGDCMQTPEARSILLKMIKKDISFIHLDPKRFTVLILNSKSEDAIKKLLEQLFKRDKSDCWNSYDTTIAINYLIHRGAKHSDLLEIINRRCKDLSFYYTEYCKKSFNSVLLDDEIWQGLSNIIGDDKKTNYLYIMYLFEVGKENWMSAYAYFKNFFDRITAHIDCTIKECSKIKYTDYYREKKLQIVYTSIIDSASIISRAHKLRNSNPISHASSELIDQEYSSKNLRDSIQDLMRLIIELCRLNHLIK